MIYAHTACRLAGELIQERGAEREQAGGERSMARAIAAFNAMEGTGLTEEQGWRFMRYLKDARKKGGCYTEDDYMDCIAYAALEAECASIDAQRRSDSAAEQNKQSRYAQEHSQNGAEDAHAEKNETLRDHRHYGVTP